MAELVSGVWRPSITHDDYGLHFNLRAPARASGPFADIGAEGTELFAGYVTESYTSELRYPTNAYDKYNEMRRRDPTLRSLVNAVRLLARQADLRIVPATDEQPDQDAADFLESCLDDMSHTVDNFVDDVFTMIPFGWSWAVIHYKRRNGRDARRPHTSRYDDGKIGWRKWMFVRQSTLDGWDVDDQGGLQGMWQIAAPKYDRVMLPLVDGSMQRSLHFVADRDGANPEGLSIFESVYEPWYFLKNYQLIQGIGWQRTFVGLPVFRYREGVRPSADDKSKVESLGEGLVVDRSQFVAVPPALDFNLESVSNPGADSLLETIKYYRQLMLSTVLADFIALGTQGVGSWALGRDKSELFIMAVNGWLKKVAEVITRYAIPGLLAFNEFPGMTDFPRAEFTTIRKPDLQELGTVINSFANLYAMTGGTVPIVDDALITWMKTEAGAPVVEIKEPARRDLEPDTGTEEEVAEATAELQAGDTIEDRISQMPDWAQESIAETQREFARLRRTRQRRSRELLSGISTADWDEAQELDDLERTINSNGQGEPVAV